MEGVFSRKTTRYIPDPIGVLTECVSRSLLLPFFREKGGVFLVTEAQAPPILLWALSAVIRSAWGFWSPPALPIWWQCCARFPRLL
jgi:hypothetical protein